MSIEQINACIQQNLSRENLEKVKAAAAAQWLDQAGLLQDNPKKPGQPLREMMEEITGAKKEGNRWYIYPVAEKAGGAKEAAAKKEKKPAKRVDPRTKDKPATRTEPKAKTKGKPAKKPEPAPPAAKPAGAEPEPNTKTAVQPEKAFGEEALSTPESCYRYLCTPELYTGHLDSDPLGLIAAIRDLTRVTVMQLARERCEDFDEKTSMIDTISMLYENRLAGKVTVQSLHIIRKIGNLATYESEQFDQQTGRLSAEMVCKAFLVFIDEAKKNELLK